MTYFHITGAKNSPVIEGSFSRKAEAESDREWLGEGRIIKANNEEEARAMYAGKKA